MTEDTDDGRPVAKKGFADEWYIRWGGINVIFFPQKSLGNVTVPKAVSIVKGNIEIELYVEGELE